MHMLRDWSLSPQPALTSRSCLGESRAQPHYDSCLLPIHLDPPPRLLDILLPALRERNELCALELLSVTRIYRCRDRYRRAMAKSATHHPMIPTPPHRAPQDSLGPSSLHFLRRRLHPSIGMPPLDLPLCAAHRTDREWSIWRYDRHGARGLA